MRKTVLMVIGTRPEAIKMAPVYEQFAKHHPDIDLKVVATGQHGQLLEDGLMGFDLKVDLNLNTANNSEGVDGYLARVILAFSKVLKEFNPHLVLVHGDTTTATAAAVSAHLNQIPVGHVEAGLRSHRLDSPWPEEANRRIIDSVSTLLFAPTSLASKQITLDKLAQVHITGNTVIDALKKTYDAITSNELIRIALSEKYSFLGENFVLATQHRREAFGVKQREILTAIGEIAGPENRIVFPVHPNPNVRETVFEILQSNPYVHLIDPVGYPDFVFLMMSARMAISDSGGIQEEAPSLNLPLLITRDTTERPEVLETSTNQLVGSDSNLIKSQANQILGNAKSEMLGKFSESVFGDGKAGERISQICCEFLR